jgi:hypothetical protein
MKTTFKMSVILFLFISTFQIEAAIIYDQPYDGSNIADAYASQNDSASGGLGDFAKAYDNFTLDSATSIGKVKWYGEFFLNEEVFSVAPDPAPISKFLIQFWLDNSGPNAELFSETILGNADETFVEKIGNFNLYKYGMDLSLPFKALAGTTYWLSIQPTLDYPPQWGWYQGKGGDGVAYQDFFGENGAIPKDLAFSLASVPEPITILLLSFGLIGFMIAKHYGPKSYIR